jgi:hypothetical protein
VSLVAAAVGPRSRWTSIVPIVARLPRGSNLETAPRSPTVRSSRRLQAGLIKLDSHLDRRPRTLAWAGLAVACALVLVADFPWGDLQNHGHWSKIRWIPFVSPPLRLGDIALNTLLCAPMGGLSGRLFRRPLLMAFALSLALSVAAEWSQVYSHTRFPSATDVTCNVAGAVLAAALSRTLDSERREPSASP